MATSSYFHVIHILGYIAGFVMLQALSVFCCKEEAAGESPDLKRKFTEERDLSTASSVDTFNVSGEHLWMTTFFPISVYTIFFKYEKVLM